MIVKTLPDITPNGVATPMVVASPNIPVPARWVQVGCSGTSGRAGDSLVSATRGSVIPKVLNGLFGPLQIGYNIQEGQGTYDLTQIYVFATGSDSISVTFGV